MFDRFERLATGANRRLSAGLGLLVLALVGAVLAVVVLRYALQISLIWMQELYVWLHATIFLLGSVVLLSGDGHVRMDLIYRRLPVRVQTAADLFGVIFFALPWMVVLLIFALPYVRDSWQVGEASRETGGMPGLFLFKTVLVIFAVLMLLQLLLWMAALVRKLRQTNPP
jgi:TRAP-type mannitol/chloroaromatic compound transport system permease small subunit